MILDSAVQEQHEELKVAKINSGKTQRITHDEDGERFLKKEEKGE